MTPPCYNRAPFATGRWVRQPDTPNRNPRWRWETHRMSVDCGTWKAPPGALPYPMLAGWDCKGCRWAPDQTLELMP